MSLFCGETMEVLMNMAYSALFTAFIECVLMMCFFDKRVLGIVFFSNIFTNVLLNFCLLFMSYYPTLIVGEIIVVYVEANLYKKYLDMEHALKYSLICNCITFLIGVLL